MKIAIIGGHLTPALSVIEEIGKSAEILYIGRKKAIEGDRATSLEYETITKKGIKFAEIKTGRLQRSITRRTVPSLTKIPIGFIQALFILSRFKPNVVVGFGGYVSFPVILAARILKIPVVIHEQTLEAGATNRIVARFADKICISFSSSSKYFPKEKIVFTGNPIRSSIAHPSKKIDLPSNYPIIYITGGSIGSHFINQLVSENLTKLLDKYALVHQTGDSSEFGDFDKLLILKENNRIYHKTSKSCHFSGGSEYNI
ncbi:MAG: glycosyltransferase [Candidatus Levybacteria bacterium]|nr:glycosyltransferase [Candidatus Levybacteria bacterium]